MDGNTILIMKPKIFTKEDFTLKDLIDITRNCSLDAIILNSSWYPNYTAENIEDIDKFEPILDFYGEYSTITAHFDFNGESSKAITLEQLIDKGLPMTSTIERDVEDGYVYSNYDNIVYTEKIIVLC